MALKYHKMVRQVTGYLSRSSAVTAPTSELVGFPAQLVKPGDRVIDAAGDVWDVQRSKGRCLREAGVPVLVKPTAAKRGAKAVKIRGVWYWRKNKPDLKWVWRLLRGTGVSMSIRPSGNRVVVETDRTGLFIWSLQSTGIETVRRGFKSRSEAKADAEKYFGD